MPMTQNEIDAFLGEPRLCAFATVDQRGRPRVRPLWYLWRDGAFWFTTRLEVRHTGRDLRASPMVAVSISSEDRPYRAVVAHGQPEVVGKIENLLLAISTRYGEPEGRRWTAGAMKEPDRVVLKMEPTTFLTWHYGRSDYGKLQRGRSMRTERAG
jgi:nitroimidazol reductase NimA-like FMN-containing flavoprotein (pyridoxamine 5'-phosphate oxidase superfamily)